MFALVRHGETQANIDNIFQGRQDGYGLNELGRRQAALIVSGLKEYSWNIVISSPAKRARQTSEIISHKLNTPIGLSDLLEERNWGLWEGLTKQQIKNKWPKDYPLRKTETFTPPEGESLNDIRNRVKDFVIEHQSFILDKTIIVTHKYTSKVFRELIGGDNEEHEHNKLYIYGEKECLQLLKNLGIQT